MRSQNRNSYGQRLRLCERRVAGRWDPVARQEWLEVVTRGHLRKTRQDIAEVGQRILAVSLARDDQRVDDGRALAGVRMTDEEPVLFADARRANRIFYAVIVQAV